MAAYSMRDAKCDTEHKVTAMQCSSKALWLWFVVWATKNAIWRILQLCHAVLLIRIILHNFHHAHVLGHLYIVVYVLQMSDTFDPHAQMTNKYYISISRYSHCQRFDAVTCNLLHTYTYIHSLPTSACCPLPLAVEDSKAVWGWWIRNPPRPVNYTDNNYHIQLIISTCTSACIMYVYLNVYFWAAHDHADKGSHLLVSCAMRTLSDEKCSSRSKRSREGGGSSWKPGGNT